MGFAMSSQREMIDKVPGMSLTELLAFILSPLICSETLLLRGRKSDGSANMKRKTESFAGICTMIA